MRLSLTARQRSSLLFLSACAYAASFAGLGEPLDAQGTGAPAVTAFALPSHPRLPRLASLVRRDPFAQTASPNARSSNQVPDQSSEPSVPDIDTRGNVPVDPSAQGAGGALRFTVRATIVGPNPVAYVASGAWMNIVRVGDTLGERRIARIDLRGVGLSDGSRLDLPDFFHSAPRPARERRIEFGIADLRRLLVPPTPASTPSASATNIYPAAQTSPAGDSREASPTPFAYPYPYPPAPRK